MRKFSLILFFLLSTSFSFVNVQPLFARTVIETQAARVSFATVPIPPPTSTPTSTPTTTNGDEAAVIARLDTPFTLYLREWATISDTPEQFSLLLTSVMSDSRCPATVNCVVAGQAEFMLLLRTGNVISPKQFHIGSYPTNEQNKVRYAGYAVELVEVQPHAPPPDQHLQPEEYQVTLVVHGDDTVTTTPEARAVPIATATPAAERDTAAIAAINQPFTLHEGERASVPDADFHVTLRSVTEDSGCLSVRDCSVMLAEGTLVLQQGDQREVLDFNVSFTPEQPFDYDFAGYVVQLVHIEQARNGEAVATFVVSKPTSPVKIPDPQRVDRCSAFSRFDAAAILQEEVAQEAIANLVFGPLASDGHEVQGMCGYVTTAFSDARLIDEQVPYIASEVAADRAMAAAVVQGDDITQLLQLAHLVYAADPDADPNALLRLQTELTAGFYENVISTLTTAAETIPDFTVSPIQGIGDEGVWLWQRLANGYFALLITREEETFSVVTALLNTDAEELTVLDYAVLLARRFDQPTITEISVTPEATPEPPIHVTVTGCDQVRMSDAAAILGESVYDPVAVAGQAATCLYVPRSKQALTSEEAANIQPEHGLITQLVTGADVADQLTSLAEELKADNPNADEALSVIMQTSLLAGDTQGALALLPQLADGAENWTVEAVTTIGEGAIWIWFTEDDHVYSAVLAADDTGAMRAIIASLAADRDKDEVREALVTAANGWMK